MTEQSTLEELLATRAELTEELNDRGDDSSAFAFQMAINQIDKEISDRKEEERAARERVREERAFESVLGQVIKAAFDHVQYDYWSTEDFPALVDCAHEVLRKNNAVIITNIENLADE